MLRRGATSRHTTLLLLLIIYFHSGNNGVTWIHTAEAFAIPRPSEHLHSHTACARSQRPLRRHATANPFSCAPALLPVMNSTTAAAETDNETYAKLLQTFMEDHAHEAMMDLQEVNHQASSNADTPFAVHSALPVARTLDTVIRSNAITSPQDSPATADDPRDESDLWRARLLLVGAAALYGTNFSLVKLLGDTMPVGISTTFRFGLAALATLPWLVNSQLWTSERARTATWLGLEVGMWNSVGYVAQAVGLETTLASHSAFICSLAVVIVPLLDFMTGEKLLPRQWVGAIMALLGVAFLELGGGDGIGDALASLTTGDALSMIQPFMFGVGFWKMEKAMHAYPEEARRMTAGQLFAVFVASAVYGLWSVCDAAVTADAPISINTFATSYPWKDWLTDPSILFSLFWTGCITTALTIYMETLALETLSATETTLIFSTEPLWGTAFAAAIMGEHLGMNAAAGAFLILSACIYSNLGVKGIRELQRNAVGWLVKAFRENDSDRPTSSWLQTWRDRWVLLPSSLASTLATWNLASSHLKANELNEIVDELMETLVDKLS